jgi:hypothetical protein
MLACLNACTAHITCLIIPRMSRPGVMTAACNQVPIIRRNAPCSWREGVNAISCFRSIGAPGFRTRQADAVRKGRVPAETVMISCAHTLGGLLL